MARVKWETMTDESQAMVKKVGLIRGHPVASKCQFCLVAADVALKSDPQLLSRNGPGQVGPDD